MISPKQILRAAPYLAGAFAGVLLYVAVTTVGWTIGGAIAAGLLGFGAISCIILPKPWCKLGAVAMALALIITLDLVASIPIVLTGGLVFILGWLR